MAINRKFTSSEFAFLAFFLPIFSLKLLDITSGNNLLTFTSIGCWVILVFHFVQEHYPQRLIRFYAILLIYTAILVFTCGKQGAFFSVSMIMAMKGIDMERKVYKICFLVALVVLLLACVQNRNGAETTRYMANGEWESMIKRSNLLYVSYTAVVCLFLLIYRNTLTFKHLIGITISGILMFFYVGARSGLVIMVLLIMMLFIFKHPQVRKFKLIRYTCILAPVLCMAFSLFSSLYYGEYEFLSIIDMAMQGRIFQNAQYMSRYDITLLGQPIYESYDSDDFWNLDNAYMEMLICEGLIFAILWIVVTCIVINYMYKRNRMVEVAIIVMYAAYGISETFLPNCFLNVSLFLYGEALYSTQSLYIGKLKGKPSRLCAHKMREENL